MNSPQYPRPVNVVDRREEDLMERRAADFEKLMAPGPIRRRVEAMKQGAGEIMPEPVTKFVSKVTDGVMELTEAELWQRVLAAVGGGFGALVEHATLFTVSPETVVQRVRKTGHDVGSFDEIAAVRSYDIEALITKGRWAEITLAAVEGGVTGAFGLPGLPFNIALSYFLYFRAVQRIALHYGYDVIGDPTELQIASETTMLALSPKMNEGGLSGTLAKMALAGKAAALKHSLVNRAYTEMAERGGAELLYVQIRALANKAAEKALRNAGQKEIEAGIFKKMLERIGANMPARVGAKAVPILAGVVGAGMDAAYMKRVVHGANIVYHKRFLFEKEHRVAILYGDDVIDDVMVINVTLGGDA